MASAATARQSTAPSFLFSRTSPLTGITGTTVFIALGITGAVVDLAVCWKLLNLGVPSKIVVAELFTILLTIGWISFSMADNIESFLGKAAIIVGLYLPLVGMVLTGLGILFWFTLVLMTVLAVITVLDEIQNATPWSKLFVSIYASWVVAGVIVTLGSAKLFGYAESSSILSEVHFLLDARYLITALLLLSAFGEAMFKAFEAGLPKIPPPPRIPSLSPAELPDSLVSIIMRPFLVFANLFLMIAQALVSLIWQLVGFIVTYLYRTGKNLAHQFYALITNRTILRALGRVVLTFVIVLLFTLLVKVVAPDFVLYLTSTTSPFSLSTRVLVAMLRVFLLAMVTVGTVLLLTWLWKPNKRVMEQTAFGGSTILVALALSAGMMYLFAKTHLLDLVGFDSIGILTLLLLLMLGSFFVYQIALLLTGRVNKANS